tara:strand:+ start:660 stop:1094 length:435 start_codon:yes stop_codon:yes gene_type:complete
MHWFRTNHNTCPLCQNQGINYQHAYNHTTTIENYSERILWKDYYKNACCYARKKNADKEIVKRVKAIKKTEETEKKKKKLFRDWRQKQPTGLTNSCIMKEYTKLRRDKWKYSHHLRRRKIATGYLYFHKIVKDKIIIAEKVILN